VSDKGLRGGRFLTRSVGAMVLLSKSVVVSSEIEINGREWEIDQGRYVEVSR